MTTILHYKMTGTGPTVIWTPAAGHAIRILGYQLSWPAITFPATDEVLFTSTGWAMDIKNFNTSEDAGSLTVNLPPNGILLNVNDTLKIQSYASVPNPWFEITVWGTEE